MSEEAAPPRALVITGPFYDWELALFAKLMRDIERSRPEQTFALAVHAVDGLGLAEAIKLIERIFPRRETPN